MIFAAEDICTMFPNACSKTQRCDNLYYAHKCSCKPNYQLVNGQCVGKNTFSCCRINCYKTVVRYFLSFRDKPCLLDFACLLCKFVFKIFVILKHLKQPESAMKTLLPECKGNVMIEYSVLKFMIIM